MSNILILDECLQNLFYAQETMKEWIPLTEYEILFESGIDQDIKNKITKNEETAGKSTNFVKKAIDAVIKLISTVLKPIREFLARITMSGEERERFEQFKAAMEKDPKLKNKKLSVLDFRKINESYDKLLKEIDQNIKAVNNNESHSIEEITQKVNDFLKGTTTAVTTIVGADLALKMANSNIEMAKQISGLLKDEEGVMKTLSESFGEKDALKFKKKIDAASKDTFLRRLKVKVFGLKYKSLEECIQGTLNAFTHAGFDTLTMAKRALNNEYTGPIIKGTVKNVIKGEVELAKREKAEKKAIKQAKKQASKNTTDFSAKSKQPNRDGVNAPLGDFIFGKNSKK